MLKLDAHGFSPSLLEKILKMAGSADSFEAAAEALRSVGEISISARTVNQLSAQLGGELADARDQRTQVYQQQPLPRVPTKVDPPPCLAAVFCDGGRMRTRTAGGGHGIHQPHWRETKNAGFHRMRSESYDHDPQPHPMMAAEADSRGFFAAEKRAFLGDGQKYNWSIQERWFPDFMAIADFIHVVEYVYEAAKAFSNEPVERWQQYVIWAEACWQGQVAAVIDELSRRLLALPLPGPGQSDTGPREAVQRTRTYLTNNRSRMDYPRYRREGLPV
ncbi:MAG TPA: hypothetical protein VGN42_25360, partial [Pirellulales bacterium]|nr:hypothetical protein [Pirellulales bacterium]